MTIVIPLSDPAVALTIGAKLDFPMPHDFIVTDAVAVLKTPQLSGNPVLVQITNDDTEILSAPLAIVNAASDSGNAPSILNAKFARLDRLGVRVTQIGDGTAKGLDVLVYGYRPSRPLATPAPPPPATPSEPTERLVDRTTGTPFGNMTVFGLGKAFDGVTNAAGNQCAAISSSPGYVGQSFAAAKRFSKAVAYGPNDRGFIDFTNPSVTITIYGKNGSNPANAVDGATLGSLTFTDTADESAGRGIQLNSATAYDHIWAYINGGSASTYCAELAFFELV